MTAVEWGVVLAGLAGVALVNWWFFLAQRASARATAGASGVQQVDVVVRGGYTPATIHVRSGEPIRLVFDRQESSSCSEEIVFPDFGIRRYLPANEKSVIEIRPEHAGTYEFMCGMSMLRGRLIVED